MRVCVLAYRRSEGAGRRKNPRKGEPDAMIQRPARVLPACTLGLLHAGPAAAAGGGLQIFPDPSTLVVLLILFAVLIPLVDRLLFRPLTGVLEERERRIEGAHARATELGKEASQLLARYQEALREARGRAEEERRTRLEQARREQAGTLTGAREAAERKLAETRGQVQEAVARARLELRRDAEQLAQEVAGRLLDRGMA